MIRCANANLLRGTIAGRVLLFWMCLSTLVSCHIHADEIILQDESITGVEVQLIRGGQVIYKDDRDYIRRVPVEGVEQIRFRALILLDQAERSMQRGDYDDAINKLIEAGFQSRTDAQMLWIRTRLAKAHDQMGEYVEAAGHFAAIINADTSSVWKSLRPTGDLNQPSYFAAAEAMDHLRHAERRVRDEELAAIIDELRTTVAPVHDRLAAAWEGPEHRYDSTISGVLRRDAGKPRRIDPNRRPKQPVSDAEQSQPLTPADTDPLSPGAIDLLLESEDFDGAIERCQRVGEHPGDRDLARFLHQYGLALAGVEKPRDAAVMFARCFVLFPGTRYAPMSLIETATIYQSLYNDRDTAQRLLRQAHDIATDIGEPQIAQTAQTLLDSTETPENAP